MSYKDGMIVRLPDGKALAVKSDVFWDLLLLPAVLVGGSTLLIKNKKVALAVAAGVFGGLFLQTGTSPRNYFKVLKAIICLLSV